MELEKNIWGANRQRAQDFEGEALFVLWFEEKKKKNQSSKHCSKGGQAEKQIKTSRSGMQ